MSYYLVLVGTTDSPLYETFLTSTGSYLTSNSSNSTSNRPTSSSSSSGGTGGSTIMSLPLPTTSNSFSIFGNIPIIPSTATGGIGGSTGGGSSVGYGHKNGVGGRHVMQLVAHASLDVIEDVQWSNSSMYLKNIDKFHEWTVSTWLTPGGVKIILLHELKNDDGIRLFLQETWEAYVKTLMNPFHELNKPIKSQAFDARIRAAAKKHL